jgi:hypothetical protein
VLLTKQKQHLVPGVPAARLARAAGLLARRCSRGFEPRARQEVCGHGRNERGNGRQGARQSNVAETRVAQQIRHCRLVSGETEKNFRLCFTCCWMVVQAQLKSTIVCPAVSDGGICLFPTCVFFSYPSTLRLRSSQRHVRRVCVFVFAGAAAREREALSRGGRVARSHPPRHALVLGDAHQVKIAHSLVSCSFFSFFARYSVEVPVGELMSDVSRSLVAACASDPAQKHVVQSLTTGRTHVVICEQLNYKVCSVSCVLLEPELFCSSADLQELCEQSSCLHGQSSRSFVWLRASQGLRHRALHLHLLLARQAAQQNIANARALWTAVCRRVLH